MDIVCLAFTLLHLLGTVDAVAKRFKHILELDGAHKPGAFLTHSRINSYMTCAGKCITANGCVTFIYHSGDKICYLYDLPMTPSTENVTFSGGSVAYLATYDVLTPEKQLYHYNSTRSEAFIITLKPLGSSATWQEANATCTKEGGELLPVVDSDEIYIFNDLDAAYPGIFRSEGNTWMIYWVGMYELADSDWRHMDGTTATGVLWHNMEPNSDKDGDCGNLLQLTYLQDPTFKLNDNKCTQLFRYVCSFRFAPGC